MRAWRTITGMTSMNTTTMGIMITADTSMDAERTHRP